MGPLVPDVVSNNLNLILAFFIGIAFGAILEQAGFSSTRKLVGLFYGYDFTVLRVFFTAGVVAMIGVMALSHFGLIDMNLVYVNPTYLWSAIIGGLIMGLGFVIGGFCPGTSICAVAIGKVDAIIFVVGVFLGVLIFAEGYPAFEGLYKSEFWGNPRIFETLSISPNLFALAMVCFAMLAFWFVGVVERKVNKEPLKQFKLRPYYIVLSIVGFILLVSAFTLKDRKSAILQVIQDEQYVKSNKLDVMSVDEFAFRLMDNEEELEVVDFRGPNDAKTLPLPKSKLYTIDNLFEKEPSKHLQVRGKKYVIVANDEFTERKIGVIVNELGLNRMMILEGGLNYFKEQIINFKPIQNPKTLLESYTNRFREKASKIIPVLINRNRTLQPIEKKQQRVLGGC